MWNDVVDLRDFYHSPLGLVTQRAVRRKIRAFWPALGGQNVLGLGYATPYLRQFAGEATRVIAAMPAQQGVLRWPDDDAGQVALCDETDLPLPDLSIDRVLVVHGVGCSENLRPMMREVWRVLSDSGRVILVVPNRRGIWARLDRTPFGHGLPYSPGQVGRLLRDTLFTPIRTERALFVPPSRSRMVLASAGAWENIGARWFQTFGGVLVVEAGKQIYAAAPADRRMKVRRYASATQRSQIS